MLLEINPEQLEVVKYSGELRDIHALEWEQIQHECVWLDAEGQEFDYFLVLVAKGRHLSLKTLTEESRVPWDGERFGDQNGWIELDFERRILRTDHPCLVDPPKGWTLGDRSSSQEEE